MTVVSDYNLGKEYTIQSGTCQIADLDSDFFPMAVPPFATYVGNETVSDYYNIFWSNYNRSTTFFVSTGMFNSDPSRWITLLLPQLIQKGKLPFQLCNSQ